MALALKKTNCTIWKCLTPYTGCQPWYLFDLFILRLPGPGHLFKKSIAYNMIVNLNVEGNVFKWEILSGAILNTANSI